MRRHFCECFKFVWTQIWAARLIYVSFSICYNDRLRKVQSTAVALVRPNCIRMFDMGAERYTA